MSLLDDDDELAECNHCGLHFSPDDAAVNDELTDALENAMHGAVGLIVDCPACGGPVFCP